MKSFPTLRGRRIHFPLPKKLRPPFPGPDVKWSVFKEWPREEFVERGWSDFLSFASAYVV